MVLKSFLLFCFPSTPPRICFMTSSTRKSFCSVGSVLIRLPVVPGFGRTLFRSRVSVFVPSSYLKLVFCSVSFHSRKTSRPHTKSSRANLQCSPKKHTRDDVTQRYLEILRAQNSEVDGRIQTEQCRFTSSL